MRESGNVIFSPAKINLFLEVISRRKDNYHNLNSLMCFCDIGDYIEVVENENFFFETEGPFKKFLAHEKNNLIIKAIDKLQELTKSKFNLKVKLIKNLPVSSGLGGGSSNAATIIKILIKKFNLKIEKKTLDKFLIKLGSDVPFCFYKKSAIIQNIGEVIKSVPEIPQYPILIVNPLIQVSTKEIFLRVNNFTHPKTSVPRKICNEEFFFLLKNSSNDLERIAIKLYPEIQEILKIFKNQTNCLISRMSGSGASCYGLFDDQQKLKEAEKLFNKKNKFWWVKSGKILNQI